MLDVAYTQGAREFGSADRFRPQVTADWFVRFFWFRRSLRFKERNKPDEPDKQNKPDRPAGRLEGYLPRCDAVAFFLCWVMMGPVSSVGVGSLTGMVVHRMVAVFSVRSGS